MKKFLIIFLFTLSLFGQSRFYPYDNELKPKDPNWGIDVDHIKIKGLDLIQSISPEVDSIAQRVDTLRNVKKVYLVNGTDTTEIYDNGDTVYVSPSNNRPIKLGNVIVDTVSSTTYYIIDGNGGEITISGGLNSDTTITFNSTMSVFEIQSAIDNIPKYLNNNTLKFLFEDGTYTLITSLNINGFYSGDIVITGNESEDSTVLKTNQAVVLQSSTSESAAFDFSNNTAIINVKNIRFEAPNIIDAVLNVENNLFTTIQGNSFEGNEGNAGNVVEDDENTELLLHFENNVTDAKGNHTASASQFTYSSVAPKFGNYNAVNVDGNDGVTFPYNTNLLPNVSNTTWTLELWVKMEDFNSQQLLFSRSELYKGVLINSGYQGGGNYFRPAIRYASSGSYTTVVEAPNTVISSTTWTHLAFVRNGNDYYIFKNGTQIATNTSAANPDLSGTPDIILAYDWVGSMDEVRISSVARWTSNFTPYTAPYGDPTGIGAVIKTGKTDAYIRSNYLKNGNIGIQANNNRVFSWNNDDDPTSVVLDYGLRVDLGATIIKNGTQPDGGDANEIEINGGEIR